MGKFMGNPITMLSRQGQRYQKTRKLSAAIGRMAPRASLWFALSMALTGCAGAQLPARAEADSVAAINMDVQTAPEQPVQISAPPLQAIKPASTVPSPVARQALIDAREAARRKQWTTLAGLVPLAQEDPQLGMYAQYWSLSEQLQDASSPIPEAELQQFMAANQDAYLTERLKADWILAAARRNDYATVLRLGPIANSNAHVDCARLLAQHMTGQPVSSSQAMAAFAPGRSCWAMLDQLVSDKVVGRAQLQPVLRATLETNKAADARRLAGYLFTSSEMSAYRALISNPRKWLSTQNTPTTPAQIELVTLALSRLARDKDRDRSADYIKNNWARAIPKSNIEWVWGQFGLVAALNVDADASQWYRRSGSASMTDYNHAWQVRSELRRAVIDWAWVGKAIKKMSTRQQAEPVWVYWYGRALKGQGNSADADKYFASIENKMDFYGQLANEELGRSLSIPPMPPAVTPAELAQARSNAGLQRAIALFDLDWRPEAVPEWNFALRGMSDRQLLAAAELARQQQIFDRVVNTSLQTKEIVDFAQRFIAPFEGRVAAKAQLINLDPAWVYGLIRQESRFITNAKSNVGASGLMQLMPATAKWVARKMGMNDFTPASVNDFDTNTVLGTNYLSMVLNDLDGSQVLATAGYNAGPRRPMQWRSKLAGPVEGAIFAETIPFTETRLYVKHVMSNATYYAMMFSGKSDSLKERLGTISPEPDTRINLP
jgi:soluble lytic murein transglycosylase